MFEFIDKIKDKYRQNRVEKLLNVQKSLSEIDERIEELSKAQSHKYIRKEPDGKGGFNYIYDEPEISKEQRDKNFKEWFGDSKVVDENGKPLVVYHGTEADFSEFKDKSSAYYFSENPSYAEKYSKNNGSIMPCYLKSIHLKNVDFEINHFNVDKYLNSFEYAMSDIDGLVGIDAGTKQKVYVVFNQNQIKSAIGNKGTFDKNSNDITKSINSYISELAQLKLNKNKLLKSEKSLQNEDPLFKSMYDHMRFDSTYREVTKAYRQGDISLDKCDEILKAINKDKKVRYSDNLVFNTEGKLLLLKRSELDKTFPGMYTIPGGHVDAGEDHRTAAIRELQEESGLTPDKDTQFQKIGEYEDDKCCIEYFRSDVDKDNDTLCLQSEEAWQYEWIDLNEIDKYEFPMNMKDNIKKMLIPKVYVIQKLGKALRNKEITKSQFIQLYKAINHKYIDKKLNKFGNFYYIYKENENSFNDGKEKENSTRIIEDSGTTIISNSIQGSPEEYKGERKASWQLNKLREEAEKKGFLEDELQNLKIQSEKVLRGTEAQVLFVKSDDDNMDVLKAFDPISHLSPKETLDDFVDRINLYNEYFSETSLYFRGLSNDKSKITILFSQKYVDGNVLKLPDPPAFESFNEAKIRLKEEDKLYKQVALELKKRYGFIPIGKEKTKYTNGKVTIQDVHLGNVMKGTDGKLYFIDLDISKNEDAIQKLGKAYKSGKITREKFLQALDVLSKSQSHKYIRKEFKNGEWEYIYKEVNNSSKEIENKKLGNSGKFITKTATNPTQVYKGVQKWLDSNKQKFDVNFSRTTSSIYVETKDDHENTYKIRLSNHSPAISDEMDWKGIKISDWRDGTFDVEIDSSVGFKTEDIKNIQNIVNQTSKEIKGVEIGFNPEEVSKLDNTSKNILIGKKLEELGLKEDYYDVNRLMIESKLLDYKQSKEYKEFVKNKQAEESKGKLSKDIKINGAEIKVRDNQVHYADLSKFEPLLGKENKKKRKVIADKIQFELGNQLRKEEITPQEFEEKVNSILNVIGKSLSRDYDELLKKQKERRDPERIEEDNIERDQKKLNFYKKLNEFFTDEKGEFSPYNTLRKIKKFDRFPKGVDMENHEVTAIFDSSCWVVCGGDWQQGINIELGLNDKGEIDIWSIFNADPSQLASDRKKRLKEIENINKNDLGDILDTEKSLQSINELYLQNKLSDELYEKIIEKAWNKSPIGTITTRSNGQKWKKVSETGNKDQDWQLVSKPKAGGKTDEPVSKEKRAEYGTKGKQPTIAEHAKESSEIALNAAIKESPDPKIREAAHQELDRREKEEHVQDQGKKDGGEKKEDKDLLKKKIEDLSNKYKDLMQQSLDDDFSDKNKTKQLSNKSKELSRYIQRVKRFGPDDKLVGLLELKKLLGLKSEKEVKDFFGDGEIISISVIGKEVAILTEDCYCERKFNDDGKVDMLEFILNPDLDKGQGKGSEIFYNQVQSFKNKGYKKLITDAAKSDVYNGYYTWARLGYEIRNRAGHRNIGIENFRQLLNKLQNDKELKDVKTVSELMTTKKGRDFWKENGFAFNAEFDLSDDSKSMFILNKYMEEKKNAKK